MLQASNGAHTRVLSNHDSSTPPNAIRPGLGFPEGRSRPAFLRPPRVLVVYPFRATFIERDIGLLETFCEVRAFLFDRRDQYPALLGSILSADVVVCWFALPFSAVAAVAARAFGRKTIVIAGGWDVAQMPEISYGRILGRRSRLLARIALRAPDLVLAFSESSLRSVRDVAPRSPVRTAYMGVDVTAFTPGEKQDLVVTVANVSRENVLRKGLRTFVDAAAQVPEAQFMVIGKHIDGSVNQLRAVATANVTLTDWLPDREVQDILGKARVYVQASYTEGFGVALAEAMSSGCVPVATWRGAIPEVIGDTGIYFEYGDAVGLATAIRAGLRSGLGPVARRRVQERFSIDRRLRALHDAIASVNGTVRQEAG